MDEEYMKLALELAAKGRGHVNPNPLVGAVIVKNGEIIGQGYHKYYGGNHAEVNAFNSALCDLCSSTIYVTLEPCSHYGKTPPCVDKIIENKISRVVVGCLDPNPKVCGNGIKKLKEAGIEVTLGVLEDECKKINEVFIKFITKKKPFVILKSAMSLDGKIATSKGESKWITSKESRAYVHKIRNEIVGIMVGVNTIIQDNPELTCRLNGGRNPKRIIVDSTLRIPIESKVICDENKINTIIATTNKADLEKISNLQKLGVNILIIKAKDGRVHLEELMIKLGELNIDGILLEGGSTLNFSAIKSGIVDKIQLYISPKIIGGENSKTPVGGAGIEFLKDAFRIDNMTSNKIGEDILIEGYIRGSEKLCLQE
ncbi:MAG: bifunctional diaminohydroxyphosphoribosylaminopyrimidine deaminase/5-amino-6-(5-phosphoribosylamino)uracil reductase RibD [Clostridium sp.]